MAASNTRFTQNSLGQSKNPIDSDHGIYRDHWPSSPTPKRLKNRSSTSLTVPCELEYPAGVPLAGRI